MQNTILAWNLFLRVSHSTETLAISSPRGQNQLPSLICCCTPVFDPWATAETNTCSIVQTTDLETDTVAIHQWAEEHRPREKLLKLGAEQLSDAELLAILLRTGRRGGSALTLAQQLLAEYGGMGELARASSHQLQQTPGMGPVKAAEWLACLELGRRTLKADLKQRDLLTDIPGVLQYVTSLLRHREREAFIALFLNQGNRLIRHVVLCEGTVNVTVVHPRELVRQALECNAVAVIVAHNHPAGSLRPSEDDLALTRRLRTALASVDIRLLDHLIVAGPHAVSLRASTALFKT